MKTRLRLGLSISSQYYPQLLKTICDHYGIEMDVPVEKLPKKDMNKILYGSSDETILFRYQNDFGQVLESKIKFEGVLHNVERRYQRNKFRLYS